MEALDKVVGKQADSAQERISDENESNLPDQVETKSDIIADSKTEEKHDETDSDDLDEGYKGKRVPLKSLKDERKKRQELEKKLAELSGQLSVLNQQKTNQQTQQEKPDDLFYGNPTKFIDDRIRQERLLLSEEMVKSQHSEDYDQAIDAFSDATKTIPGLLEQLRASVNPARFAYDYGKAYLEAKDMGSIAELREKIRAEEKAKLEEEFKQSQFSNSGIVRSNASARGSSMNSNTAYAGPPSLGEVLRH